MARSCSHAVSVETGNGICAGGEQRNRIAGVTAEGQEFLGLRGKPPSPPRWILVFSNNCWQYTSRRNDLPNFRRSSSPLFNFSMSYNATASYTALTWDSQSILKLFTVIGGQNSETHVLIDVQVLKIIRVLVAFALMHGQLVYLSRYKPLRSLRTLYAGRPAETVVLTIFRIFLGLMVAAEAYLVIEHSLDDHLEPPLIGFLMIWALCILSEFVRSVGGFEPPYHSAATEEEDTSRVPGHNDPSNHTEHAVPNH